jgi:chromosome condensin MukBEF MukE localization factor
MPSSGMLRRVDLVRTHVSEEVSASLVRVTRIPELGMLAVISNRYTLYRNTKSVASYG